MIPSQSWLMPLGIPSTAHKGAEKFGILPMRDTDAFTTSRVQVKMLGLPAQPAAHITLPWSPGVQSVQSGANVDESQVAPSMHFFSSRMESGGTELLSNWPMARPDGSLWLADSKPTAQAA